MKDIEMNQENEECTDLGLTPYAASRMGSRGVSPAAVRAAIVYGRKRHTRGAEFRVIGRNEVERLIRQGIDLRDYEGVHVVRSADGDIITVYRNRDLRGLRPRRRRGSAGRGGARRPLLH